MTEYESDPQRRPAPTDAEPSHPTAELPHVERAQSDSPTTEAGPAAAATEPTLRSVEAAEPASAGGPTPAAEPTVGLPAARSAEQPTAGLPTAGPAEQSTAGLPAVGPAERPTADGTAPAPARLPEQAAGTDEPTVPVAAVAAQPTSAAPAAAPYHPTSGQPGHLPAGGHPYPAGGSGHPAAGGYPGGPWYSGQHSGWTGGGQPGAPGPVFPQQHPGQPTPPWAPAHSAPRPGRIAKFAGAGVAVLALMLGSGVAGGALALAVDGDSGGITRTYSAAPVINGADLPRIAASVQDSVVSITTDSGEGSGVILTDDGYVLTNNHVVAAAGGNSVRVVFADGKSAQARIVGTDPKTDLAVVKASGVSGLQPATLGDSDAMQVGDQVLALGSPLGLQGSVTAGILSARDRTIQAGSGEQRQNPSQGASSISGLLQTDAPINPGNSGGALVNTRGEVIGINTAIATAGQGSGNIGVGFAIPSNKAKDVAGKLQRGEKVSHPSLGVSVNAAPDGGALVAAVTPGSAAEKAGLRQGDVITRFGDKVINDSNDLVGAVQAGKVGDRVEVTYQRNGSESTATVTLAEAS
ncbi:putative serine protease PepD [Micromonospora echinaurantiaca]|uniref:Putative serine protease PepD n=1 Tax=Micromonospora echinaurantiaca TaxID=47857 RepID=A0A1C5GSI4_9ACTN|nr:trypsin-like peptidase domain-containing protein [Micromonospora echinaurantiaca]SCG36739.1 putative serine protease PepD [Micromonospora echinaurantiaca]